MCERVCTCTYGGHSHIYSMCARKEKRSSMFVSHYVCTSDQECLCLNMFAKVIKYVCVDQVCLCDQVCVSLTLHHQHTWHSPGHERNIKLFRDIIQLHRVFKRKHKAVAAHERHQWGHRVVMCCFVVGVRGQRRRVEALAV